ncbi:MAG: DNA repair protein RadC [Pseudomonadota bacterium]|nr:DNA repair protein RadC [Pseudomonadota bacterium]
MTIRDWPKDERPREKLLLRGPTSLSDAELLAVFLRTGVRGKTAVDLARQLLRHFGGLAPLLDAGRADLSAASGIGIAKYAQVQAALELGRRYLEARLHREDTLSSPEATRSYLMYRLKGLSYEAFLCLFLDNRHRVISCEEMFRGTVDSAQVYPREVVKRALVLNAAAVILAHNHPSGEAEPSHADRAITARLKDALALIEVRVLDHLVIGDGAATSMAERGLM